VLVSRLQSDPARYDVIFPSRDRLCLLLRMKLLAPLPVEQLTNRRNIDPEYLKLPCDRRGKYFAPYLMGSTGLGYNDRYVPGPVDSWRELVNPKWGKRAAFLNNGDEVLAVALILMGQSANTADRKVIFQAGEMLAPIVHASRGLLDPIQIRELLASNQLAVAQVYSGEGWEAERRNPHVHFVIPVEGCVRWVDMMAIPAEAPHRPEALRFINYMLEPEVNAACAQHLGYGTPNLEARKLLPASFLNHPAVSLPPERLARCEFFDINPAGRAVRNRVWESLKKQW
jgi:spermidine/putrescine transport system substrate-binding protein